MTYFWLNLKFYWMHIFCLILFWSQESHMINLSRGEDSRIMHHIPNPKCSNKQPSTAPHFQWTVTSCLVVITERIQLSHRPKSTSMFHKQNTQKQIIISISDVTRLLCITSILASDEETQQRVYYQVCMHGFGRWLFHACSGMNINYLAEFFCTYYWTLSSNDFISKYIGLLTILVFSTSILRKMKKEGWFSVNP